MVRILSNGEIVSDDDPRAASQRPSTRNQATPSAYGSDSSRISSGPSRPDQQHNAFGNSILSTWNEKLISLGIPRWSLGGVTIEPIVLVAFLISFVIFGLPGIFFGIMLFAASQLMGRGNVAGNLMGQFGGGQTANRESSSSRSTGQSGQGGGNRNAFTGSGQRLGSS